MIKIAMTCRNRLEVTKKAIEALYKHTEQPFQLYCFDNLTNYRIKEHFEYFWKLYEQNFISQVTFNTNESTFNAFSKAASLNSFGLNHEQDPKKDSYDFLTFIDNDIIVSPGWDVLVHKTWNYIKTNKLKNIYIVSQLPGGIKYLEEIPVKIDGFKLKAGKLGGSGFWNVQPNFFTTIGYLDLKNLVGLNKRHDQQMWPKLNKASGNKSYICGIETKLGFHVGNMAGSVCNALTQNNPEHIKLKMIEFSKEDEEIKKMNFDDFYELASTKYRKW